MADTVAYGRLSIRDLHKGVAWANAHDHETLLLLGDIFSEGMDEGDRTEAFARRLAHCAGRSALGLVGSNERLYSYHALHKDRLRRNGPDLQAALLGIGVYTMDITRIQIVR